MVATLKSRSMQSVERIAISKARSIIGQLVNRVHVDKDRFVLEKSGIPVAALIDIDEYKRFLAFQEISASKQTISKNII